MVSFLDAFKAAGVAAMAAGVKSLATLNGLGARLGALLISRGDRCGDKCADRCEPDGEPGGERDGEPRAERCEGMAPPACRMLMLLSGGYAVP